MSQPNLPTLRKTAHVISLCVMRDSNVWAKSSPAIAQHIRSENFIVIVPDAEQDLFKKISSDAHQVIGEGEILPGIDLAYVQKRMPPEHRQRAGWYFQQILKIAALLHLPAGDEDVLVIWDADTIPLININFVRDDGKLVYFKGTEHHAPYFATIERLLGLQKIVDFSFIAQCFPITRKWVKEFVAAVERRSGKFWVDAILDAADLTQASGFSEYETMGTFLTHTHAAEMAVCALPWDRFGARKYSLDDIAKSGHTGQNLAYISFESWDFPNS